MNTTPVLIWCHRCQRYISKEHQHPCTLPQTEHTRRRTTREHKELETAQRRRRQGAA